MMHLHVCYCVNRNFLIIVFKEIIEKDCNINETQLVNCAPIFGSLNQVEILARQLHMFLSYADIPAHLCPRERKILSGSLTPAEIPISILPAGHTDIKALRK